MKVLNTYIIGWAGKPIKVYECDNGLWFRDSWDDIYACYRLVQVEGTDLAVLKATVHAAGLEC